MKKFFQKIYACLFQPKKIGLFLGEKLHKSFIQLFIFSLITIIPVIFVYSFQTNFTASSYESLSTWLMEDYSDLDMQITNSSFSGSEGHAYLVNEGIVFLNPNDEVLELESLEYASYHVIELDSKNVRVTFLNNIVYEKTYEELGVVDLDFKKISNADYIEFDKFMVLIDQAFASYHATWVIENSIVILFDVYLSVVLAALILSFAIKIFAPMKFRFRLKLALDTQFISLVLILLMFLFNIEFIRYIGILLSAIYSFIAIFALISIQIKKEREEN